VGRWLELSSCQTTGAANRATCAPEKTDKMNFQDWLTTPLFSIFGKVFNFFQLLGGAIGLTIIVLIYRRVLKKWLPRIAQKVGIADHEKRGLTNDLLIAFGLLAPAILIKTLAIPDDFRLSNLASIGVSEILFLIGFVQIARFFDHLIAAILPTFFIDNPQLTVGQGQFAEKTRRVRYLAWTIGGLWFVHRTERDWTIFSVGNYAFKLSNILAALLVVFSAQLVLFLLKRFTLSKLFQREKLDAGTQFSINCLFSYIVYILASILIFQSLGIEMTVVWGSMAAVLVGAGLGLREAVNDFISGVILLFEKTIRVGDFIEVQGQTGVVKRIGFRTSLVETRDSTTVVVPNSKLFSDKVINFQGENAEARFRLPVRVGFEVSLDLVEKLMLESVNNRAGILEKPAPKVRTFGFFEHGVELELLFFVQNFDLVDDLKSEIRTDILKKFQENKIRLGYEGGILG
jgi:small-conductance mechanosensitive channel